MKITDALIKEHGLAPDEYRLIVSSLGREPNLVELGIFSVMWSEHCSYKSSRRHLKGFPTKASHLVQGPGENAGVVDIGDGYAIAFKMESHNHPSFIEPYQGAATGVGGILRDVFTMGARPVASLNSLRFGSPENPRTRALVEGVVAGIAGYGNAIGVPTVGGEVFFNASFNGNCLVNVMTAGVMKKDRIFKGRAAGIGNPVVYVGSRTGRDGIHGATMASDAFGQGGEERRPTVQVGDPFTEKLLLDACLELFKTDCIVGIQDMGAAGLTSSSAEMASRGSVGMEIDVDRVPRREEGMTPYEVMLSESQERMLMVARAGAEGKVKEIFGKWDLEAEVIGRVIEERVLRVMEGGRSVAEIPVEALTERAPVYDRPSERPSYQSALASLDMGALPECTDHNGALLKLLSSANMASREWIYRQYDHMVRTDTLVLPGSDAAVIRIKGTRKAIALSVDCNSRYCRLDPFRGAVAAVAEAARNIAVSGARPLALTDCLNFGSPERPEVMWQFKEAIRGITEACVSLGIPVAGGNVSFYNETSGVAIYPTPAIGMLGLLDDASRAVRQWFGAEGRVIALMGEARPTLGGSEYLSTVMGIERGLPPEVDLSMEKRLHEACLTAAGAGIISSAHDVSDGGLACALAESCLNPEGAFGATVEIDLGGLRPDEALFGESASRVIVSLREADAGELARVCSSLDVPLRLIGTTGGATLRIGRLIELPIAALKEASESGFKRALGLG
jgi:phosphoribosylformylglycinamidine synthase